MPEEGVATNIAVTARASPQDARVFAKGIQPSGGVLTGTPI